VRKEGFKTYSSIYNCNESIFLKFAKKYFGVKSFWCNLFGDGFGWLVVWVLPLFLIALIIPLFAQGSLF
jgi:hypothetical protein